jgi:integrase
MGSIRKRRRQLGDGTLGPVHWQARYRDANGRSRSQSFDRRIDAERFLERNGADLQRGEWVDPRLRRSLFSDWADEWWATTVRLRPNTRRGYWLLLQNHVLPCFGERTIAAIDWMDVERFIADRLKAGHGAKHVREMVTVVSLIMKCAIKSNARKDNPAAGHELRVPRQRVRQAAMLTMEQVARLVACTLEPYRPAIWLLVFTGLRPAELCGLRVGDVDLIRGVVHVSGTRSPVPAYDGGVREHVDGLTKSEASQRSIPIPSWLCLDLAAMLATRGTPLPKDAHLFVNKDGHPLNRDTFRARIVRPALRAADLPDDFRTYDFRHTHASLLIDDGANVLALAERMGHTDPAITLRTYGHLFEGVQEQLTERLDQRRRGLAEAPPGTGGIVGINRRRPG